MPQITHFYALPLLMALSLHFVVVKQASAVDHIFHLLPFVVDHSPHRLLYPQQIFVAYIYCVSFNIPIVAFLQLFSQRLIMLSLAFLSVFVKGQFSVHRILHLLPYLSQTYVFHIINVSFILILVCPFPNFCLHSYFMDISLMIPSFLILTEVFRLAEEFYLQYFCFVELLEATFVLLFVDQ